MRSPIVAALALPALLVPFFLLARARAPESTAQNSSAAATSPAPDSTPPPANSQQRMELQARIYMARKQYTDAADLYTKLSLVYPRNASYLNFIGIAKQQMGDLTAAGKYYQRATKVDKRFADAYSNLGTTWYARKYYRKAISAYKKAISLEPTIPGFYTNLGYTYFAEKQIPLAMDAFHKALAIDPNVFIENDRNGAVMTYQSVADRGLFDFMLAKGYAQSGDAARCAAYLKRAIEDGYKDVLSARTDPAFAKILDDPDVKAALDLAEPPPPPAAPPANPSGA